MIRLVLPLRGRWSDAERRARGALTLPGRPDRVLRRRMEKLLDDLDLPPRAGTQEILARLGDRRGRRICLVPVELSAFGPCGLWISTLDDDYIVYPGAASPGHQAHIIRHEIGHIVCGHFGRREDLPALVPSLSSLPMHLSPETVRRILARTHYRTQEEREAELLATLLSVSSASSPRGEPTETDDVARRIGRSLGGRNR